MSWLWHEQESGQIKNLDTPPPNKGPSTTPKKNEKRQLSKQTSWDPMQKTLIHIGHQQVQRGFRLNVGYLSVTSSAEICWSKAKVIYLQFRRLGKKRPHRVKALFINVARRARKMVLLFLVKSKRLNFEDFLEGLGTGVQKFALKFPKFTSWKRSWNFRHAPHR